ncbi:MAG: hypothetical protein ABWZ88_18860 [Variovorax sp.]
MILRVVAPPSGVVFAVQRGRDALLLPCDSAAELLSLQTSFALRTVKGARRLPLAHLGM